MVKEAERNVQGRMKCFTSCFGRWLHRWTQLSKSIKINIQDLCIFMARLEKFERSVKKKNSRVSYVNCY